jgi:hypothetical protein
MSVEQESTAIAPYQGDQLEVTLLMDEREARQVVAQIQSSFDNARALIDQLKEREGWKVLGYKSWRECVTAEFGQSQAYLYRQLAAAQIEKQILPGGEIGLIPEAHLRPLAKLPEAVRAEVWEEVVESAPEGGVTQKHAAAVVERRLNPEGVEAAATSPPAPLLEKERGVGGDLPFPVPDVLEGLLSCFLGYPVGVATMPSDWPWEAGARFVNLMSCKDLSLWVERAIAASEKPDAEAIVLWVPAQTDQDWFARLSGGLICFVSANWLKERCDTVLKQCTALVYFGSDRRGFVKEFRKIGEIYGHET